jgi:hypothetical protein
MQRPPSKIKLGEIEIFTDDVIDLIPGQETVLLKARRMYLPLVDKIDNKYVFVAKIYKKIEFNKFKFDYIKEIKTRPDPEDRVADFEWRDANGLPDFDKRDKLVEGRKTRKEKQQELDFEIWYYKEVKKRGWPYYGPLDMD